MARPQLVAELDRSLDKGMCLVIGSAGSGKTSLLAQWAASRPADERCWINVDAADREPVRFWKAVVQAVEALRPAFGSEVVDFIDVDGIVGPNSVEALVDAFALLDRPITLILDDLHLAQGDVDDALRHLIVRRPPSLRLAIGSRSELSVDLGRLRTADDIVEIRDRDLLLGRYEAEQLLAGLGATLDDADFDLLMKRTEGWAAGVHLAGVALAKSDDPAGFVRQFAASNEVVAHYLSTRVLDAQRPEMVEFMLDTCVVDELTPDLAAELSSGSPVRLHDIEAAHLMLFRNSATSEVFRYHHLLLDLLRLRLHSVDPERARRLHRVAADWCASNDDLAGSFHHLWRADERESAMRLLKRNLYDGFVSNTLPQLEPRDIMLSDDDLLKAPGPAIGIAIALCIHIRHDDAARLARRIEQLAGDRLDAAEQGDLACVRTFISVGLCDMESTIEYANGALAIAADSGLTGDAFDGVSAMLVKAHAWAGNWVAAEVAAERVDPNGPPSVASIEISGALANLEIFRGRLDAGIGHARRNRALVAASDQHALSPESNGIALLGIGLLERGDVSVAERLFRRLDDPAERARLPPRVMAHVGMSRIHGARGDFDEAMASLDSARGVVPERDGSSCVVAYIDRWAAHHLFIAGEYEWSAKVTDTLPDGVNRDLAQSRLLLADGNLPGACEFADRAAELSDCVRTDLEVALARLACSIVAGDDVDRLADDALTTAAGERFVFMLAGAGGDVFEAIQRRARQMLRTEFLEIVLRTKPHATSAPTHRSLVDPLTERECLVLRYLATSLSYREIAGEMFVSVNTLKTHVKNAFRKLDASSRDEALERGRRAGYL